MRILTTHVPLYDLIINNNQESMNHNKNSYHLLNTYCMKDAVWGTSRYLVFSRSVVSDSFATPWTATQQAPLSMGLEGGILEWVAILVKYFTTEKTELREVALNFSWTQESNTPPPRLCKVIPSSGDWSCWNGGLRSGGRNSWSKRITEITEVTGYF